VAERLFLLFVPRVSTLPFMPLDPFVVAEDVASRYPADAATDVSPDEQPPHDVCAIVLAGTHQWGDGVFERVLRGPLLPVAHTPLIEYPLQWLRDAGIRTAVLCANSATSALHDALGSGSPESLALRYFEDGEPRGPAGCARDAAVMTDAERFIVLEGTIIPTLDCHALLSAHRASGAAATVVVEFDRRRRGMASGVRRQPAGIYVFEREVLSSVAATGYQDIKEGLLGRLNDAGRHVAMHEVRGLSAKVLDYSSYASVSRWLVSRAVERPTFLPHYFRVGEGMHHPTAFVHPSARLVGPVLLAAGARVEDDAVIVGPATIGQRSIVGSGAIVTRSFVWDDCVVGDGAIVDSSVLADRSLVTPGEHLKNVTHLPEDVPLQPRTAGSRTPSADLMPGLTSATEVLRTGFAAQAPAARAAQR